MNKPWDRFAVCPTCGAAAGEPCRDLRAASGLRRAIRYGVQNATPPALKRAHAARPEASSD